MVSSDKKINIGKQHTVQFLPLEIAQFGVLNPVNFGISWGFKIQALYKLLLN